MLSSLSLLDMLLLVVWMGAAFLEVKTLCQAGKAAVFNLQRR